MSAILYTNTAIEAVHPALQHLVGRFDWLTPDPKKPMTTCQTLAGSLAHTDFELRQKLFNSFIKESQ